MTRRVSGRRGSAMTEFALLAPVYVLLLIGLIYFANEVLLWQESQLAARFLATNSRSGASGSGGSPLIANTSGANVPEDYFVYFSAASSPRFSQTAEQASFLQKQVA